MRENLATLYAAVEQGFASPLPAFVKDELEGYVACGVLSRGFAILQCENAECRQKKLVASVQAQFRGASDTRSLPTPPIVSLTRSTPQGDLDLRDASSPCGAG